VAATSTARSEPVGRGVAVVDARISDMVIDDCSWERREE
jgi:hypothetical protein